MLLLQKPLILIQHIQATHQQRRTYFVKGFIAMTG